MPSYRPNLRSWSTMIHIRTHLRAFVKHWRIPTGPSAALAQAEGTAIDQTSQCIGTIVTCNIFRDLGHWFSPLETQGLPIDDSSCNVAIYSALEISSANAFLLWNKFKKKRAWLVHTRDEQWTHISVISFPHPPCLSPAQPHEITLPWARWSHLVRAWVTASSSGWWDPNPTSTRSKLNIEN